MTPRGQKPIHQGQCLPSGEPRESAGLGVAGLRVAVCAQAPPQVANTKSSSQAEGLTSLDSICRVNHARTQA